MPNQSRRFKLIGSVFLCEDEAPRRLYPSYGGKNVCDFVHSATPCGIDNSLPFSSVFVAKTYESDDRLSPRGRTQVSRCCAQRRSSKLMFRKRSSCRVARRDWVHVGIRLMLGNGLVERSPRWSTAENPPYVSGNWVSSETVNFPTLTPAELVVRQQVILSGRHYSKFSLSCLTSRHVPNI